MPPGFQEIPFFRSRFTNRRLDDEALRILESVLVARDMRSLMKVKSRLTEFVRAESIVIMRQITGRSVEHKLLVIQFFVHAFALLGDVESCLAMTYEGLHLRELKSKSQKWLQVSHTEWIKFAQNSIDYGFYSIAIQACDSALLCLQKNYVADIQTDEFSENIRVMETIHRLKDHAVKFAASRSVKAQAAEYSKRKKIEERKTHSPVSEPSQFTAATQFINGVKKRNERKLCEYLKSAAEIEI